MRRLIILLFVISLLLSCSETENQDEKSFSVVAVDFPSYDAARAILGSDDNLVMLLPPGTIPCCPLCSTGFHQLPHYYEAVRLLTGRQGLSVYKTSIPLTTLWNLPDLPGMQVLPSYARHALLTPTESPQPRACGWFLLPATRRTVSASALYNLRGCIASRFPIAALALLCLRLNLTLRLRLPG